MNMAELLNQNTQLIHELNRAVISRDWASVEGAAFKLSQHNMGMISRLHDAPLPPVLEPLDTLP
jgi:hypothetical protein